MESALDVRTQLRLQSLVLAIARAFFDPSHHNLIKLQRLGYSLDSAEASDQVGHLIYKTGHDFQKDLAVR